jgi:hypothetical protein
MGQRLMVRWKRNQPFHPTLRMSRKTSGGHCRYHWLTQMYRPGTFPGFHCPREGKTLAELIAEYFAELRSSGHQPAGDGTSSFTLNNSCK